MPARLGRDWLRIGKAYPLDLADPLFRVGKIVLPQRFLRRAREHLRQPDRFFAHVAFGFPRLLGPLTVGILLDK